jgi:hypothetical protein
MKIPGYRSRTGWKMGLASLGYGLLLLFLVFAIMGPFTEEAMDVNGATSQGDQEAPIESLEVQDGIVDQYLAEIDQITYYMDLSLTRLRQHMSNIVHSQEWIEEARDENNIAFQFSGQLRDFETVPRRFETAHALFIEGSHQLEQFHARVAESLDAMEAGDYERVMTNIDEAIPFCDQAQDLFQQAYFMIQQSQSQS